MLPYEGCYTELRFNAITQQIEEVRLEWSVSAGDATGGLDADASGGVRQVVGPNVLDVDVAADAADALCRCWRAVQWLAGLLLG